MEENFQNLRKVEQQQFVWNTYPIINALYDYLNDTNGELKYIDLEEIKFIEKNKITIDNIYLINSFNIIKLLVQPRNYNRRNSILAEGLFSKMEFKKSDFFYNKIDFKQPISRFSWSPLT